jgi:type IV pilus assembly protein PilW
MQHCWKNWKRGFTLVELLIAMAIALVVIASLSSAFISQRKTFNAQEQISEMIQSARAATDMIAAEVRMVGYDPLGVGIVGIPSYSTSQLQIQADLDSNGDSSGAHEDITFTYDGTNMQIDRNTGGGAQPLAENIQLLTFEYYNDTGSTATTAADIREIKITVTSQTADPDPDYGQYSGYRRYTLITRITPPNLAFTNGGATTTTSAGTTTTTSTTTTSSTTTSSTTTTSSSTTTSTTTTSTTTSSTTTSTTTTSTSSTTTTSSGGGCTLSVAISACKKDESNEKVFVRAYVSDGLGPVTDATVTSSPGGALSHQGGGYYGDNKSTDCGLSGSNFASLGKYEGTVTITVTASKSTCTSGSASKTVP